jgi:hypothetical protein
MRLVITTSLLACVATQDCIVSTDLIMPDLQDQSAVKRQISVLSGLRVMDISPRRTHVLRISPVWNDQLPTGEGGAGSADAAGARNQTRKQVAMTRRDD